MTGVSILCIVEQRTNASFKNLKNITNLNQPGKIMPYGRQIIVTAMSGMGVMFMFTGMILLLATLTDQEGLVQVFVWLTFLNIVLGFILTFLIGCDCLLRPACILSGMDWLSAAATLVIFVTYLFIWFYFVVVANSYVLNVYE
ncbi:hypothetical protein ABMA28_009652 [Loxostege sticticalis]|uniref:MARVEL domain-containing protein n=1 Tax=Loxostege sticticalis TaxID=481309 RepID=A0ABD0SD27_LOXSC